MLDRRDFEGEFPDREIINFKDKEEVKATVFTREEMVGGTNGTLSRIRERIAKEI